MAADRPRRVVWADAFTDTPLTGNPCAVVFDAADVPVETRLAFTRETKLSECAFLVGSDKADFGARYYLASREIPMAGHPTVATAAALDRAGLLAGRSSFTLELGGGVFSVAIDREGPRPVYTMTQGRPVFGDHHDPALIGPLMGLPPDRIVGAPRTVSTGNPFCITRLRDHDALAEASLDTASMKAMWGRVDFLEPFVFVLGGFTERGATAARLMLVPPEPLEDPFTGSATGSMAAYAFAEGLVPRRFVAEQGHLMGRPGQAQVEVLGEPERPEGVRVGGTAVVVMDGEVYL
ncbi:MAG: PhzF family phenazine biosynthesis protein [Pseudomonadota bacterium]